MSLTYFRPRGDVAANWKAANPVLKEREMVVEWESAIGVGQPRVKFGKAGGTTREMYLLNKTYVYCGISLLVEV